jgi:valyl-tRNA synthetase
MDIPSKFDAVERETHWYNYWMQNGFFNSDPDNREPYTIVIPPPNVTGVLHMGHMLNNTIQDILIRRARMLGRNALWVPGIDHASIATEARVVAKLASEGIKKSDISREDFLKYAWEWKEKHGGIILEQLKKLGASCDWRRTRFTMDERMSESVIKVFVDLYRKGHIYRGVRMVNWDPQAMTAVSDEEVNFKEVKSKLYFVKYKIVGEDNFVTVATTRPETILGDTGLCVHPEDERYAKLKGKKVLVPLINREIPVIFDSYVDREFGTGALKITPAHDLADYELGLKYHLDAIDIFNDDGTLNEKAQLFVGTDRFKARELVHKRLKEEGLLADIKDYDNKLGFSERTNAVIEPRLSVQWFVRMKEISLPAYNNVMNDNIKLYPSKYKNSYRHWMENVKDWCISRQLWWGHRIPAYYLPNNEFVVAETPEEALKEARIKLQQPNLQLNDLKQDEDVLDTWFSSWLWPISVFDGIRNPNNKDMQYYYPTNDLITAPEIIFFWVARMIIAGYEYQGEKPFTNVYFTGIVRDKLHRKMSKSLGNSPDPLDLIEKYTADGVRIGMLLCSPAGNDLLFDESLTEQGRNFSNKIWNAFRLLKGWSIDDARPQPDHSKKAVEVFTARLDQTLSEINDHYEKYRLSEALMAVYKLFWDDFASWYLEIIKPEFQKPIDRTTYAATVDFFDKLLKILHPFMPFITEELWHMMDERKQGESIMMASMPMAMNLNNSILADFELVKDTITSIRSVRTDKNISPREPMNLFYKSMQPPFSGEFMSIVIKLANILKISPVSVKVDDAATFIIKATEFYIPIGNLINTEEEIKKLNTDLEYARGFLQAVEKKLSNERFVQNAPTKVLELEQQKKADAESKIKILVERIASLSK